MRSYPVLWGLRLNHWKGSLLNKHWKGSLSGIHGILTMKTPPKSAHPFWGPHRSSQFCKVRRLPCSGLKSKKNTPSPSCTTRTTPQIPHRKLRSLQFIFSHKIYICRYIYIYMFIIYDIHIYLLDKFGSSVTKLKKIWEVLGHYFLLEDSRVKPTKHKFLTYSHVWLEDSKSCRNRLQ